MFVLSSDPTGQRLRLGIDAMLAFLNESRAVYESQSVAGTCEEGGSLPLAESGSLSSAAVVAEFPAPASDAGSVSDAEASPMSTCSVQTVVSSETEQALRQSLDSMRLYARTLALLIGRARRRLLERPQAFEQVESLQGPLAAAVALHVRAVRILRASIFSRIQDLRRMHAFEDREVRCVIADLFEALRSFSAARS